MCAAAVVPARDGLAAKEGALVCLAGVLGMNSLGNPLLRRWGSDPFWSDGFGVALFMVYQEAAEFSACSRLCP